MKLPKFLRKNVSKEKQEDSPVVRFQTINATLSEKLGVKVVKDAAGTPKKLSDVFNIPDEREKYLQEFFILMVEDLAKRKQLNQGSVIPYILEGGFSLEEKLFLMYQVGNTFGQVKIQTMLANDPNLFFRDPENI